MSIPPSSDFTAKRAFEAMMGMGKIDDAIGKGSQFHETHG
jgi:hypothetical protein